MDVPKTHYARTADGVHIAYQVVGDGPVDLVLVASALGLGEIWRGRRSGAFLLRLASFSRLILLDRRGMGLSDHILDREQQLTLESRMEDVRAVMDAVDSARATLLGLESGGFAVAAMFAATLPERTAGLIAYGAMARELWAPDYPFGVTQEESDAEIADVERAWATDELASSWVEFLYPSARDDAREVEDLVALMRGIGGPGDAATWSRVDSDIDLRAMLPSIRVPTLVIHRREDRAVPIEHGRYLAAHIPGAELAELPGEIHMWDVGDDFPSEVERFVATIHREEIELDRFLATVLFTDIVDSTSVASARGDQGWARLVERHHHIVRGNLARYRGTEMDTAGDGFFATFDGPARAVRCALAVVESVRELSIEVRAGVHTGEMQTIDGKAGGIAVTLGARVAGLAAPSEVLVSQTVRDLVAGSGLQFADAGEHELKGVPDRWRLYRVVN
ncbi:MAG: adenylate/guanylate cyclase domain-containing protein [Actinomycetota bacterium]|nr:adenylate/guanylate cyclase domain-containing protein [Actinomycetota bacterium]